MLKAINKFGEQARASNDELNEQIYYNADNCPTQAAGYDEAEEMASECNQLPVRDT